MPITAMNRLAILRFAMLAIPDGSGIAGAYKVLSKPGEVARLTKEACAWAREAVDLVRTAADPNPWRDATDEDIAAEVVRQAEARLAEQRKARVKS